MSPGDDIDADEKELEEEDPHKFHGITREQAEQNVAVLKKYSRVILPKLCNLFETSTKDEGRFILETIHSYAKVSDVAVLNQCFMTLTKKILEDAPGDMDEGEALTKWRGTRYDPSTRRCHGHCRANPVRPGAGLTVSPRGMGTERR